MKKIIFATGNKDKMREIREILSDCDVDIQSMKEAGINVDIVEDGKTFENISWWQNIFLILCWKNNVIWHCIYVVQESIQFRPIFLPIHPDNTYVIL